MSGHLWSTALTRGEVATTPAWVAGLRERVQAGSSWIWPLLAVVGAAVTMLPRLRWINIYEDQALISGMAMQTAAGQVPYRDFDTFVAPGSIFMYAAYYKLVGASVVHQRLLTATAMLISVWLVARIGRRVLPDWWAAAVALLWGVWLPVFQEFSPFHFWSVTFLLAMAAQLLRTRSSTRSRLVFVSAGLCGSAALVMLQASIPAVIAGLVVAFVIETDVRRSVLPMLLALMIPIVSMLVVLALLGALPGFFASLVYNVQVYRPNHALPFPWQPALLHDTAFWEASAAALWAIPMHWLLAVVAPITVAIYSGIGLWRYRRGPEACPDSLLIGILAVGLFASALIVHLSDQNFWLCAALTLVLVARWLRRSRDSTSSQRQLSWLAGVPVAAIYLTGLSPLVLGYALVCHTDGKGFLRQVESPNGAVCVTYESAPIVAAAVRFSAEHPDSQVAFLPTAPALYEITGRVPPVPEMWVVPGLTQSDQLAKLEAAMATRPVEWVVYYKVDFRKDLPADRALQDGSPFQFDQFLQEAYIRQDQDGLEVYRRRG
jgi:hypothetical protein